MSRIVQFASPPNLDCTVAKEVPESIVWPGKMGLSSFVLICPRLSLFGGVSLHPGCSPCLLALHLINNTIDDNQTAPVTEREILTADAKGLE